MQKEIILKYSNVIMSLKNYQKRLCMNYYNRINIPITQIIELTLEPQKFVWGIYDNVRISYTDKKGKKRSTTLFLQEPQKFINEVEKIRKSSK